MGCPPRVIRDQHVVFVGEHLVVRRPRHFAPPLDVAVVRVQGQSDGRRAGLDREHLVADPSHERQVPLDAAVMVQDVAHSFVQTP